MTAQKRTRSNLEMRATKGYDLLCKSFPVLSSFILLGLALILSFAWISAGSAQDGVPHIRMVRSMEVNETGPSQPAGLAYSPRADAFLVLADQAQGQLRQAHTDVIQLNLFADPVGSTRLATQVQKSINVAFDQRVHRLLLLQSPGYQLVEVLEDLDGQLDLQTLAGYDAPNLGLQEPQGMAVDPASGQLWILDRVGPRLVRVEPEPDGSFDQAMVSSADLSATGLSDVRGLAFDPTTGHLHLVSVTEKRLVELTQAGQVAASRDLSEFGLGDPQGLVFAPSGDQTDDPGQLSLYLAVRGSLDGSGPVGQSQSQAAGSSAGQIVEFSLTAPVAPAAISFEASSIKTTNLEAITPPSPDPSGLAYVSNGNKLVMVDGEVEETVDGVTHFQGANVWELTLGGSVIRTANISKVSPTVAPVTNEAVGVAWNPANGHYFITADEPKDIFDLNPGPDGQIGTADDSWTSFNIEALGSGDPEGIAFDSWQNRLFVVDGVNREVYQFTLGGNLISHFDVERYGVNDPESVEFNPESGTLFILSSDRRTPVIIETTTSGALLQTIGISVIDARTADGLAYAPASDGSGTMRFYIVDRGFDNNADPNIIDGKMYEMTAQAPPATSTPTSTATSTPTRTVTPTATHTQNAANTATPIHPPTRDPGPSASRTPAPTDRPFLPSDWNYLPQVQNDPQSKP